MTSKSFEVSDECKVSSETKIMANSVANALRMTGVDASVASENLREAILAIPEEFWIALDAELEVRRKAYIANVIINSITWFVIFCVVTSIAFWMVRIFMAN